MYLTHKKHMGARIKSRFIIHNSLARPSRAGRGSIILTPGPYDPITGTPIPCRARTTLGSTRQYNTNRFFFIITSRCLGVSKMVSGSRLEMRFAPEHVGMQTQCGVNFFILDLRLAGPHGEAVGCTARLEPGMKKCHPRFIVFPGATCLTTPGTRACCRP